MQVMKDCSLAYIPDRLKTNGREAVEFKVGEKIYRRTTEADLKDPYTKISVCELSHNRAGEDDSISIEEDVLFSIKEAEPFEVYEERKVCTLVIKSLNDENKFHKSYTQQQKDGTDITGELILVHDPDPCMYPHCVFRVMVGGEIVDFKNYKATIGKLTYIRSYIKDELKAMIIQKIIDQNNNPKDNFNMKEAAI